MQSFEASVDSGHECNSTAEYNSSGSCGVNVTLMDSLAVPESCRQAVSALLANCSTSALGLPVCPATDGERYVPALYAGCCILLVICLLAGLSLNSLSAITLLRTRCLRTLCNRLVFVFCLVDTALSLLFPVIQLVSWTAKESPRAAKLVWLAELTCAPRRFVLEVSTNARLSLVVSIALLRYLVVCRGVNPPPTLSNTLRASLPGLALALARTINNQLTLTSYCSHAYAVTDTGLLIPSLSYDINTNISSMTDGFRFVTIAGGVLVIVFCYGSIAVKTVTTRLKVRRTIAKQKKTLMQRQTKRIDVQSSSGTNAPEVGGTGGARSDALMEVSNVHCTKHGSGKGTASAMPPVEGIPSTSQQCPSVLILNPVLLQQQEHVIRGDHERITEQKAGSSKDAENDQLQIMNVSTVPPNSSQKHPAKPFSSCDDFRGELSAQNTQTSHDQRHQKRSQFGTFLTIPGQHVSMERRESLQRRQESSIQQVAQPVLPVLRVSAPNHDVMTSVTLLVHLMVFPLAFLPPSLAMSLLFDRRACYQTPLQYHVLSFCLFLLFLVQTSLNTPLLLFFSSQFRAALRTLLRDIAAKFR